MFNDETVFSKKMLPAGLLAGSIFFSSALTKGAQENDKTVGAQPASAASIASPVPRRTAPPPAVAKSQRGADFYRKRWGIEQHHRSGDRLGRVDTV